MSKPARWWNSFLPTPSRGEPDLKDNRQTHLDSNKSSGLLQSLRASLSTRFSSISVDNLSALSSRLPDAIPVTDRVYRLMDQESSCPSENNSAPPSPCTIQFVLDNESPSPRPVTQTTSLYENFPTRSLEYCSIPDLLNSVPFEFDAVDSIPPVCSCHAARSIFAAHETNRISQAAIHAPDKTKVGGGFFRDVWNRSKQRVVTFRRQKATVAPQPPACGQISVHRCACCEPCRCYLGLDPVELMQQAFTPYHVYENAETMLRMQALNNRVYGQPVGVPRPPAIHVRRNEFCRSTLPHTDTPIYQTPATPSATSRNKLNLTIDTSGQKVVGNCFYDPVYEFIINSPILNKLREIGFQYPKNGADREARRRRLWIGAIAFLIFAVILIVITNSIVAHYLIARTVSNQSTTDTSSGHEAQAYHSTNNINAHTQNKSTTLLPHLITANLPPSNNDRMLHASLLVVPTTQRVSTEPPNSTVRSQQPSTIASTTTDASTVSTTLATIIMFSTTTDSTTTTATSLSTSTTTQTIPTTEGVTRPSAPTWLPEYPQNVQCRPGEFRCLSGYSRMPCLTPEERCDGIQDCSDGSDESYCDRVKCFGNFQCANGECISLSHACNGVTDCSDGSDEANCESFQCQPYEFRCPSGLCIPNLPKNSSFVCDGDADCPDHADEFNCSTQCRPDQFMCPEGWCIPEAWRCNGVADCAAAQDEQNCGCAPTEAQCAVSGCVAMSQLCDGIPQCKDGSDEWDCVALDAHDTVLKLRSSTNQHLLPVCADSWATGLGDLACQQLGFRRLINQDFFPLHLSREEQEKTFLMVKVMQQLPIGQTPERLQYFYKMKPARECQSQNYVSVQCEKFACGEWKASASNHQAGTPPSLNIPTPSLSQRHKRIVGGYMAGEHEWPSIAALYHPIMKWTCTAAILAPSWLITSGLCIRRTDLKPRDWKVIAGNSQPMDVTNMSDVNVRDVRRFLWHPSFKFRVLMADFDVVLVQLSEPLELPRQGLEIGSPSVAAVCLPDVQTEPGSWCVTAGWGFTTPGGYYINKVLKQVDMGVWSRAACNSSEHYPGMISPRMMCAWNQNSQWGPCFNDEGAPLMCAEPRSGRWYLAGILTYHNCGSQKHPAIYADVLEMSSWIRKTIGLNV